MNLKNFRFLGGLPDAVGRLKRLIVLAVVLFVISYSVGLYLGSVRSLFTLQLRLPIEQANTAMLDFFGAIYRPLFPTSPDRYGIAAPIFYIVLLLIIVDLYLTFVTTTLAGAIPFVGTGIIVVIFSVGSMAAGIFDGAILNQIGMGAWAYTEFGTALVDDAFKWVANIFAVAAGINIALAPVKPKAYAAQERWTAFKMAWKDAARIYIVVLPLLALNRILPFILVIGSVFRRFPS